MTDEIEKFLSDMEFAPEPAPLPPQDDDRRPLTAADLMADAPGALSWDSEIKDEAPEPKPKRQRAKRDPEQVAALAKAEADRIRQSEATRAELMKAINAGTEDYKPLFLLACKCIAEMTGDSVFYNQIAEKVGKS